MIIKFRNKSYQEKFNLIYLHMNPTEHGPDFEKFKKLSTNSTLLDFSSKRIHTETDTESQNMNKRKLGSLLD